METQSVKEFLLEQGGNEHIITDPDILKVWLIKATDVEEPLCHNSFRLEEPVMDTLAVFQTGWLRVAYFFKKGETCSEDIYVEV